MAEQTGRLEQEILILFRLAFRQNRPDVAEHLLRALETLEREPGAQEPARCHCSLMEAYGELIRPGLMAPKLCGPAELAQGVVIGKGDRP